MDKVVLDGDLEDFEATAIFVGVDKTVMVAVAGASVPAGLAELDSTEATGLDASIAVGNTPRVGQSASVKDSLSRS